MTEFERAVRRTSILPMQRRCRIALTGGPGGGKTTAADLFRRELGEAVVVVPESATILFAGGFPRTAQTDAERSSYAEDDVVTALAQPGQDRAGDAGRGEGARQPPRADA